MPISGFEVIPHHMVKVREAVSTAWGLKAPNISILDLGVGTGQWGFLFRNYLDFAYERIAPDAQKLHLVGVEGFPAYRNPGWDLYNEVIIGDIREIIKSGKIDRKWDFVNMIEVLEHFTKEDGVDVLRWIADHSKAMMFSFYNGEQGEVFGNPLEIHRAKWSFDEINKILPGTERVCGDSSGMYLFRNNHRQQPVGLGV